MSALRRVSASALCAAAFLVVQAAAAAPTSVAVSGLTPTLGGAIVQKKVIVKIDDLNPSDPQGAIAVYARLNLVAGKLCGSNPGGELLADKIEKCRVAALAQAVKDVGTPELDAVAKK